jgi:multidrug efflux pump subunit AcrA (membrane-fusion protein)
MVVAIVAIMLALVAGYLAFTYRQQVDDWEAAASETVAALKAAGVELQSTVESGVAGYEQQIADLSSALEQAQVQAGASASAQAETEQQLADTQAELESTTAELDSSEQQLAETQAQLDDANAKLEQVGELVLPDGTYIGPVLGARTEPIPAIIFQDGTAWRVAEVAEDARITSGGQTLTLEEFAALLQSTDPVDIGLVNGNYKVKVQDGLVTSMQKSSQ